MTEQQNPYSAPASEVESVEMATDEFYSPVPWTASGRIGRIRFMAYNTVGMLVMAAVFGLATAAATGLGASEFTLLPSIAIIVLYVFMFIWTRRRLNDTGFSGWFQLVALIPLVNIIFYFYLIFAPGEKVTNKWGAQPEANGVLVMILGLAGPILFVVGILAAIAMPAFYDYSERAEYSEDYADQSEYSDDLESE